MTPFKLLEPKDNETVYLVELTGGQFQGIIYEYGKVELQEIEDSDEVKLAFVYNIVDKADHETIDTDEFIRTIGDILSQLIEEGVKNNSIVYSGGVDENRENDIIESDT
jgi:hypothetical protein